MTTFSSEQLNFFKFSTIVIDEFPVALRRVFVHMWDNQVAPIPGFQKRDDSLLVRNMCQQTNPIWSGTVQLCLRPLSSLKALRHLTEEGFYAL